MTCCRSSQKEYYSTHRFLCYSYGQSSILALAGGTAVGPQLGLTFLTIVVAPDEWHFWPR
jgi:hypothetical protein